MRHALITGGSRGIGAAAVRAFTAAGYAVSFFYEKTTRRQPLSRPRQAQRPSAATWPTRRPCWTPFRACRRRTCS
ncbi:MAG: hypothetical protein ACLRR6_01650 [Oscillospiraceae bacterium]